jgi:Tol biopolymer transport system component
MQSLALVGRIPISLLFAGIAAGQTSRVSVGAGGLQGNSDSAFVSGISSDGRFVAFVSAASNLVPGDSNLVQDVFVRDRSAGTTVRASVSSGGAQGLQASGSSALSLDGRFVAFVSRSSNLVAGDLNASDDVFVRDLLLGSTERASVATGGIEGNDHTRAPSISGDGRFVAFVSRATNLVSGDTNGAWDAFVRDRLTGATERVSLDSSGAQGNGDALVPSISAGGRCVTFTSAASNLVTGDTNGMPDVFVHDRVTLVTTRVSVSAAGGEALLGGQKSYLSADGRFVSFESSSGDLVPGDTNFMTDVFVVDRASGTIERVSVDSSGAETDAISSAGPLSADGRFVTFTSLATNLVAGDVNGSQDAFVHDRANGTTVLASVDSLGAQGNGSSSAGALSADGRFAVFTSYASNLVAGDTNLASDVFVIDRGPIAPASPAPYCTAGTTTNGCLASIAASAQPSASFASACVLTVSSVEGARSGLVFYGVDNSCFLPLPWGTTTSYLCIKSPLQRTALQFSGGTDGACDGALALDWNAFQQSHAGALGQPWLAGDRVYAQSWFRDPPNPKTTSLSNAIELIVVP